MQVRFRLTPRQLVIQTSLLMFVWAWLVYLNVRVGGAVLWLLGLYGVAILATVVLSGRWRGLELGADGVTVRRNRRHFVPWTDVTEVRAGSLLLTRLVVFETPSGPVRSWAPATSPLVPDRDFDEKLAYIRQWWWSARQATLAVAAPRPVADRTGWGVPVPLD